MLQEHRTIILPLALVERAAETLGQRARDPYDEKDEEVARTFARAAMSGHDREKWREVGILLDLPEDKPTLDAVLDALRGDGRIPPTASSETTRLRSALAMLLGTTTDKTIDEFESLVAKATRPPDDDGDTLADARRALTACGMAHKSIADGIRCLASELEDERRRALDEQDGRDYLAQQLQSAWVRVRDVTERADRLLEALSDYLGAELGTPDEELVAALAERKRDEKWAGRSEPPEQPKPDPVAWVEAANLGERRRIEISSEGSTCYELDRDDVDAPDTVQMSFTLAMLLMRERSWVAPEGRHVPERYWVKPHDAPGDVRRTLGEWCDWVDPIPF